MAIVLRQTLLMSIAATKGEKMQRFVRTHFASGAVLVATVLCFCFCCPARAKVMAGTPAIRARVAFIDKHLKRYRKVERDVNGKSTEGGGLRAYFEGKAIRKIEVTYYGEMGRLVQEHYFWGGQTVFVFKRGLTYDRPLSGHVVRTKADRFYFQKGRLMRWVKPDGKPVAPRSATFAAMNDKLLQEGRELLAISS